MGNFINGSIMKKKNFFQMMGSEKAEKKLWFDCLAEFDEISMNFQGIFSIVRWYDLTSCTSES